jgi:hypothetical protein
MTNAKTVTLQNKNTEAVAPRTVASAVSLANGKSVEVALGGCWIEFTDENGNPTDIPYLHWIEEVTE